MQTRASLRRAAEQAAAAPQPGWPLLHLPAPAQRVLVKGLCYLDRCSLRLACKAATQLVDEARAGLHLELDKFTPSAVSAMRARFPCLTRLSLTMSSTWDDNQLQPAAPVEAVMGLMGPGPWASIRRLELSWVLDEAMAAAIAACPNLEACEVYSYQQKATQQTMRALASLPHLGHLSCAAARPSADAVEALLSLSALTSLEYRYEVHEAGMPDVSWDFRAMSVLQQLVVEHSLYDKEYDEDEQTEEHRTRSAQAALTYPRMQLPPSLRMLQLDQWPEPTHWLPRLRKLWLLQCTATVELLALLASGCPALEQPQLWGMQLSQAAHAAPGC